MPRLTTVTRFGMASFHLIDVIYRAFPDGTWKAHGRGPQSGGTPPVDPPPPAIHGHAEIAKISGVSQPAGSGGGGGGGVPPTGNRNVTAGALAPGAQTYPVPTTGSVFFVSVSGSDAGAGTQAAPFRTIAKGIAAAPTGGTVVVRAGSYNEGGTPGTAEGGIAVTRNGVTLMGYPGEAVYLDGSITQTGWTADTTSRPGSTIWRSPYALSFDRSVQFARGSVDGTAAGYVWLNASDSTGKVANIYDQVFLINSAGAATPLKAVGTVAEVVPGKFFVQGSLRGGTGSDKMVWNATALFIGNDPSTYTEVRVSNKTVAMTVAGSSASDNNLGRDFTIKGIWLRRYAAGNCDGGVIRFNRTNCTAENVGILDSSSVGVSAFLGTRPGGSTLRHVTIQRAGLNCAHYQQADSILIEDSDFEYANTHNWNYAPAAGGIKITSCVGAVVKRSKFNNNNADGFWCDASVFNVDVITCDAINNGGHGFEYEISADGRFIDCLAINNGKDGFLCRCSDACEYWYCTSTGAAEVNMDATQDNRATVNGPVAGVFGQDSRYSGKDDPVYGTIGMYWWVRKITVQNCVIVKPSTTASGGALRIRTQGITRTLADFGPQVNGNLYSRIVANSPTTGWVLITTGYPTFTSYKAAGTAAGVSLDPNGIEINGHDVLNSDYSLKSADETAALAVVPGMNSTIATILGLPVGTKHVGAFL